MKYTFFIILLFAFILDVIYPARIGGLIGLTIANVAIYTVGLALITTEFIGGGIKRKRLPGVRIAIIISAGVFLSLFYAQYNGVVEATFMENARKAKNLVFEPAMLYILAFLLVDNKEQGHRFLLNLVIVLGILNLVSVIAPELGINIFRVTEHYIVDDVSRERFSGLAGNPNKTAYLTCLLIIFQYYFFKLSKAGLVKNLLLLIMLTELAIIILSGSRGGLLMLFIAVIYMSYKLKDKRIIYTLIAVAPILIGILLVTESTLLDNSLTRMEYLASGDMHRATSGRALIWGSLLTEFSQNIISMLIGNGFGAVESMGIRARAHNLYMEVLIEFGIVGLSLFLYFIWSIIKTIKKYKSNNSLKIYILAGAYVIIFAWFFSTLIGILELIAFTWGIAFATMISPVSKKVMIKQKAINSTESQINV